MLFNSYQFLFLFLPLTMVAFYTLGHLRHNLATGFLAVASVVFYASWDISYLPVLSGSIIANFIFSRLILSCRKHERRADVILIVAIVANLTLLFFYKYADFALSLIAGDLLAGSTEAIPLGLSFFTFTQIAFLVDARRADVRDHGPVNYLLFVTFFPHLIAGPILHHKDMMPQFARLAGQRVRWDLIGQGIALFSMGLFKKVVLADPAGGFADTLFTMSTAPTLIEAWAGTLSYAFQIYFDFSGYSDMAVGLGLLFGIRLPINFSSPYRATSIIEFWRCWHITLSTFLRDYLYFPLGGNRRGMVRRWMNLSLTMLLGGLWHGANLTFVIWGGLHGLFLVINHAWRHFVGPPARDDRRWVVRIYRLGGWALTFLAVLIAWVFFRAANVPQAIAILEGMAGLNGVTLPITYRAFPGMDFLADQGVVFDWIVGFGGIKQLALLGVLGAVAFLLPNSQMVALGEDGRPPLLLGALRFAPSTGWTVITWAMLAAGTVLLSRGGTFLYFQF
jgi:Predicted membrane protein involved in D-alanine export